MQSLKEQIILLFGPTFDTSSKKKNQFAKKIIQIKDDIKLPFVFIGGINHENIKMLKKFKPNYVAIINSLWNFKAGPIESAYKFKKSPGGLNEMIANLIKVGNVIKYKEKMFQVLNTQTQLNLVKVEHSSKLK